MSRARFAVVLLAAACHSHPAPTRAPKTLRYTMITVDRPSGSAEIDIAADGSRHTHFTFNDRGRGPDVTTDITFGERGIPLTVHAVGHGYDKAPIDERVETADGKTRWSSTSEHGEAPAGSGYYAANSEALGIGDPMLQYLLAHPKEHVHLLPAGEVWIDDVRPLDVTIAGTTRHLRQVAVAGWGFAPTLEWVDEDGEMFAVVSAWISAIAAGAEPVLPQLLAADRAWLAGRAARLASTLAHKPPAAGLAITHANRFDAATKTLVPDSTVIVQGDRIVAVGDASTPIPAGARVVDAHGQTLLPGLWDMHVHIGDNDGVQDLAFGITTVRDLGNDIADLTARVQRFDAGTEVGPRVVRAGLIDGKGPLAAPTGVLADTEAEARAAVDRYADLGYVQIKAYSSLKPSLIPAIADETHKRHLRLSGHIPNGMTAAQAVDAGYDEIQHVNFLLLQFLTDPDDDTRTPLRYVRVAERAAGFDLDRANAFLDQLVAHDTVIDPTICTFENQFVSEPGDLDPGWAPYLGRLPATVERGTRSGALDAHGHRDTFRASFEQLKAIVKRAFDRHIRIVAGTDNAAGFFYPRELELYVAAGIPAPDVLQIATLGAARVMHLDSERGSIEPGKQADLVLVAGDPTRDISKVRHTRLVISRGVAFDPSELFAAIGMKPDALPSDRR